MLLVLMASSQDICVCICSLCTQVHTQSTLLFVSVLSPIVFFLHFKGWDSSVTVGSVCQASGFGLHSVTLSASSIMRCNN